MRKKRKNLGNYILYMIKKVMKRVKVPTPKTSDQPGDGDPKFILFRASQYYSKICVSCVFCTKRLTHKTSIGRNSSFSR